MKNLATITIIGLLLVMFSHQRTRSEAALRVRIEAIEATLSQPVAANKIEYREPWSDAQCKSIDKDAPEYAYFCVYEKRPAERGNTLVIR